MPKDHCIHMQFLIKQKEKNEDIRITCAETAKYNKWKRSSIYHYTARGKNMPVFKKKKKKTQLIFQGERLNICVYVSYHC